MAKNGIALSLRDKVALVTGGSRGIGAATVKMFLAAGACVMFSYQKNKRAADEVVRAGNNRNCAALQVNLHDTAGAKKLIDAAVRRFGRLDILVANHGIWPPQDFRAARRGLPLRLRRHQGCGDQHGEGPLDRTGARWHLCELCGAGMGGHRHGCPGAQ